MSEPMYHFCCADVDGCNIERVLESIPGQPFGIQNTFSQCNDYIVVTDGTDAVFSDYPQLLGHKVHFNSSRPGLIMRHVDKTFDLTVDDIMKVITDTGPSGDHWSAE